MFISSLCVNSVMIRSVFAVRKTHMGAIQAAPAPSTCNSRAELSGGGDDPHGSRAHREEHVPEDPEKQLGGKVGSQSREKAAEHEIGSQKSNSYAQNLRLARPVQ